MSKVIQSFSFMFFKYSFVCGCQKIFWKIIILKDIVYIFYDLDENEFPFIFRIEKFGM